MATPNTEIDVEIKKINDKLLIKRNEFTKLRKEIQLLETQVAELKRKKNLSQSLDLTAQAEFDSTNFSWSKQIQNVLQEIFKIQSFRHNQVQAINATLSKKDVLLLMPTGGGKSLCYQLPTIIEKGVTLVVSPLIALIEDQTLAMNKLGVVVKSITNSTSQEEKNLIHKSLNGTNPTVINLLYVTPEFLSKSKKFKSALQKCYQRGSFNRIAVDEVHCISEWGHDFRPDYNFLSLLKSLFPKVPIIGLTATATLPILLDVQKVLNIEGCLIFKSPFNRENLFYEVLDKPGKNDDVDYLHKLLTDRFQNKSGIIYTSTVKDTEDIANELRKRGLRVAPYHANLEPDLKKKVHIKWLNDEYQIIVATIAFGMGIDKKDVRFVIHYSLPKTIESLYQESGRAGRDGQTSHCITLFRITDYLKSFAMANSKREETKLLSVLQYCLDYNTCRRKQLALHFEEEWNNDKCSMCDACKSTARLDLINVTTICNYLYSIIENASSKQMHLTFVKLVDAWYQTGDKNLRIDLKGQPKVGRNRLEIVIAYLLLKEYLTCYKNYTAYTTYCYIEKQEGMLAPSTVIQMPIMIRSTWEQSTSSTVAKRVSKTEISKTENKIKRRKVD